MLSLLLNILLFQRFPYSLGRWDFIKSNSLQISKERSLPKDGIINELHDWHPDRMIECIFCIDYDNFLTISVNGCQTKCPLKCRGNVCFMKQHEQSTFLLTTSGCLNITAEDYESIKNNMSIGQMKRKGSNPTQLCEMTRDGSICLCTNANSCNNLTTRDPFTEYTSPIYLFDFHEIIHFKYFVPNEKLLKKVDTRHYDEILKLHYVPGFRSGSIRAKASFLQLFDLISLIPFLFLVL